MNRITATYEIESPVGIAKASEIMAGEQSTGTFGKIALETDELRARHGATIDSLTVTGVNTSPSLPTRAKGENYERGVVTISWPIENLGTALPNLMSTIAGNLFELAEVSAIRMTDIGLPKVFAETNPGPAFGADGTRAAMGGHIGPLIGTIIKPCVGLGPDETATLVSTLVDAGIDFIKDDELQANGSHCPFSERVEAVMRMINSHSERTGKKVMYAFNITDEIDQMKRNLDLLRAHDASCAMVCVNSVGLSGLRAVRDHGDQIIHGHRAGWGLYSRSPDIGISFPAWQKLWRLAGADHLHVNGLASKFTEPDPVVAESAKSVQTPLFCDGGADHLAMPVFSSAQTIWQIEPARSLLGNDDFIFCAGGGIMSHPSGVGAGVVALRQAGEAARKGISIKEFAAIAPELKAALECFKKPKINLEI